MKSPPHIRNGSVNGAGAHAGPPAPVSAQAFAASALSGFGRVMSRSEMANFVRELSTALMAGLPLVQALRTLARQGRSPRQKQLLAGIIEQVEHGRSLGDAAASAGKPFSELTINLVRAGEASGKLGEVLRQAADLLDRDVKLRRALLAATLYPMILASLITIAVIVIVTVIVPKLLAGLPNHNLVLPLPTRIVQGVAHFFGGYWWLIIPGLALGVLGLVRTYGTPGPRLRIDRWLLSAPLLGPLLRDVAVARFTRTLGTLTSAGIPILQALRITRGTLGNRAMEGVIDEVCEQVSAGKTIAEPMERSGYFPPMLVQIVNLGERSGRLDEMLTQAADAFEDKTESSVKIFTTALPPVLVVVLACLVGFVVLSIMLPLLQFQESLK
jgi:type II secretory pathway component PulF